MADELEQDVDNGTVAESPAPVADAPQQPAPTPREAKLQREAAHSRDRAQKAEQERDEYKKKLEQAAVDAQTKEQLEAEKAVLLTAMRMGLDPELLEFVKPGTQPEIEQQITKLLAKTKAATPSETPPVAQPAPPAPQPEAAPAPRSVPAPRQPEPATPVPGTSAPATWQSTQRESTAQRHADIEKARKALQ